MNVTKILILIAFTLFTACKNNPNESTALSAEDSAKYSGSIFTDNIRSTKFRTPEEERLGFKLPPGFEIQLYASEPDIGKPMNISFDAKGRMWVTQSFEYPFPAVKNRGTDHLTILEDTDNDGRADRFTHFNDSLNIPIGVLPLNDGAVAYSIPYVYRFSDANSDGKSDGEKKLFGPFKTNDTHGMINNFVRGFDGWIHACHGYTNRDTIAGSDGDSISMISGNTFRFRPDGSRVEHTTDGRINPFGLVYDELGYLYSTDCHTSPLYQLIRGGDYLQWGKEEGMGYAPDMKSLSDEATALAGIGYYADVHFPEEYRKNFYVGDVVRCRIYRYSSESKGSTPIGKREPDFLLSEDPWFRPVDVKLGPDGAIYIADFYNSIIGHYEVPLDHPKRDHTSGRIWRVTYKGKQNKITDWTKASLDQLLHALDLDNMPVRFTAADQLSDRLGQQAVEPLKTLLHDKATSTRQYVHALWVLQRLNALENNIDLIKNAAENSDPIIRLHSMRILAELNPDSAKFYSLIIKGLSSDKDPHVRRAAVELLGKYPGLNSLHTALDFRQKIPDDDNHMVYTSRLCLRTLLRNSDLMKQAVSLQWKESDAANITDVMPGVPTADAGLFLYNFTKQYKLTTKKAAATYQHLARYVPKEKLDDAIVTARKNAVGISDSANITWFKGMQQGIAQRGMKDIAPLTEWGKEMAESILTRYPAATTPTSSILSLQTFAVDITGKQEMRSLIPQLKAFLSRGPIANELYDASLSLKTAALNSLIKIDRQNSALLAQQFLNDSMDVRFRNAVGKILGEFPAPVANNILENVKSAPPSLQTNIAMALAGSTAGKDVIFKQIKRGLLFARVLLQPSVGERMLLNITPTQRKQFNAITASLDPIDKEKQTMIDIRLMEYETAVEKQTLSVDSGKLIFVQNCAPCHSIGGQGGSIGPNLDGVNQWGPKALAEKILDPNRNVSENFRNYTIKQKDGKVLTGLYRRDEGAIIVFADISGKEFSIPKKDIAEQTASRFTLMPDNFSSRLTQHDFNLLVNFLGHHKN